MSDNALQQAVRQLAGVDLRDDVHLQSCEVDAVDVAARTCTCTPIGGVADTQLTAMLMAEVSDGLLYIPAIGSTVIVAYTPRNVPHIALFSELDKVLMVVGGSAIELTADLLQLNDGVHGGLVKVAELTAKLNSLENLLNSFIALYNAHVHTANNTPTVSLVTTTLTPTERAEIENPKVTHGE